jgi:hypothetical protein
MTDDGVERQRDVAAEDLDDDAEEQQQRETKARGKALARSFDNG